jgi:hypothetical protein
MYLMQGMWQNPIMSRIEMGVGIMLAAGAALGFLNSVWMAVALLTVGVTLFAHGAYDEFVKPRVRVEHRLKDWFLRRDWGVEMEQTPSLTYRLNLRSGSSGYPVIVIREKRIHRDFISFTGLVPLHPDWIKTLNDFTPKEREALYSDVRIYLTGKNMSFELPTLPDGGIIWPPLVCVQTAIPQDHTLSQHSSDIAAKSVELSMIGVRDVIRKAVASHVSSPGPAPGS